MDDRSGPVLWILLAASVLGLLAPYLVRWVPGGHLLVITRRGVVARVVPPGLAVRAPTSDAVLVVVGPDEVPLTVRATTRDGTPVRLLAHAVVRVVPPAPAEQYVDPVPGSVAAIERVLGRVVESGDLLDLPARLRGAWPALLRQADRETTPRGVRVLSLRIAELDAVLTSRLGVDGPD